MKLKNLILLCGFIAALYGFSESILTATSIIGLDSNSGEMYWRIYQFQDNKIHANTPVYYDGNLIISSASRKDSPGLVSLKLSTDYKKGENCLA